MSEQRDRTFVVVKPDGVQRRLVGAIIDRFEKKGFQLVGLKLVCPSEEFSQQQYIEVAGHSGQCPALVQDVCRGTAPAPAVAMVWEGVSAVTSGRQILAGHGAATATAPGTVHCSDSDGAALREVALWFNEDELVPWTFTKEDWLYKSNE